MKLALISMRPKIADVKANIKKMEKYIIENIADMYIFGEMTLTGYILKDEYRDYTEKIDGPSIKYFKQLAKKHNCYIVFGMPIYDEHIKGIIHNSAVLVHPSGQADIYHKWFLVNFGPFEEKYFFDEGEELTLSNTKFGKIGLIICYDIFFPELCKAYSQMGADMVICISASPTISKTLFELLMPARAVENTIFFIYSNLVGTQEDLMFWGGSQVYDPLAKQLVKAPYFKESIVTCDIDLNKINYARAHRPVIRNIRPEIYQDLYHISRKHFKPKE
jgi:predicted amidohydrolase